MLQRIPLKPLDVNCLYFLEYVRGSNVMKGYRDLPEETARVLRPGAFPGERVLYTGDFFKKDYPAEKYYRDVKLCTIGEGTSEIQRLVIARQILMKRSAARPERRAPRPRGRVLATVAAGDPSRP